MKKIQSVMVLCILVLSTVILFSGCKKKSSDTTYPSVNFIVTYTTVQLNIGEGVQFFAKCNSTDVQMTKVEIRDPLQTGTITYNLNNTTFVKDEIFGLQDAQTGYLKEAGTYVITFTGLRTADGKSFVIPVNVGVSK
jgi:hypothetical protein